ncbi:formylmethanofuran dehydrogenase subunit C [Aquabacterium sp. OR-4]|uniref:formylmethanofuran dehydrogenase subunit C n=1 Tax=Aquabacterium sp. OR-4 TaxID=2978127 RepID=UPI0021B3B5BE|nr:formylmethanofuran dehydrogenase subunit C [Aquabacterium sp. OR-4]MDT7838296.1 formylmethanofuran dehydrogenase subunit C [Aquabacterium sp. OR-4]
MSGWRLALRRPPPLRLDLRGLTPAALAGLGQAQVERWPLGHGRETLALAECFDVSAQPDDGLLFEGNLSRCDHLGWGMDGGRIRVLGPVGDGVGTGMRAGELRVDGNAGDLAACEMAGGLLHIGGDVGHFAASTLPGSIDGMRGGLLRIDGHAGDRLADRMRRGTVLLRGDAGAYAASRLVAGTVLLGGRAGAQVGYGMRRGSVVCAAGPQAVTVPGSFVPAGAEVPVFWALLSRSLARLAGPQPDAPWPERALAEHPFAGLGRRPIQRHLGDRAQGGFGELIHLC